MAKKVAIQGYEGSFHQVAAQAFLGEGVAVIPCATFRDVVRRAALKETDGGLMAIENSIAGSILPNYTLLQKSKLTIAGEIYLQIHQNLLTNPGAGMENILEVHSHPMALLQCVDYLEAHPAWKLVETVDTALSAKELSLTRSTQVAVIASTLAAKLYSLQVLAPKIQSAKANFTRFLYLVPEDKTRVMDDANKASVNFQTDHSKGSLARVLSVIADGGINLSKLQSMPIPEAEWMYSFHADMEFDTIEQYNSVMKNIRPATEALRVLGIYQKGKTIK